MKETDLNLLMKQYETLEVTDADIERINKSLAESEAKAEAEDEKRRWKPEDMNRTFGSPRP